MVFFLNKQRVSSFWDSHRSKGEENWREENVAFTHNSCASKRTKQSDSAPSTCKERKKEWTSVTMSNKTKKQSVTLVGRKHWRSGWGNQASKKERREFYSEKNREAHGCCLLLLPLSPPELPNASDQTKRRAYSFTRSRLGDSATRTPQGAKRVKGNTDTPNSERKKKGQKGEKRREEKEIEHRYGSWNKKGNTLAIIWQ